MMTVFGGVTASTLKVAGSSAATSAVLFVSSLVMIGSMETAVPAVAVEAGSVMRASTEMDAELTISSMSDAEIPRSWARLLLYDVCAVASKELTSPAIIAVKEMISIATIPGWSGGGGEGSNGAATPPPAIAAPMPPPPPHATTMAAMVRTLQRALERLPGWLSVWTGDGFCFSSISLHTAGAGDGRTPGGGAGSAAGGTAGGSGGGGGGGGGEGGGGGGGGVVRFKT